MTNMLSVRVVRGALLGVGLTGFLSCAAWATTNVPITWDPNGSSPAISSTPLSQVTFDNISSFSDYATIVIPANPFVPGSITESGYLLVKSMTLNNSGVGGPYLIGSGPGIAGGYGLYFSFTATSHANAVVSGDILGQFDTLSYQLLGYSLNSSAVNAASVSFANHTASPAISVPTATTTLASGALLPLPVNQANILGGVPSANATVSFAPGSGETGFFVAPPPSDYLSLDLQSAFTNTPGIVNIYTDPSGTTYYQINGGGGNANFSPISEPGSVALLAFGLLGLITLRTKRI